MSAAPSIHVFTSLLSDMRATTPMTMDMMRNHTDASWKYHSPSGAPVIHALHGSTVHAPAASSYTPPSVNRSTPKFCQGMNPTIMTRNASPNSASAMACTRVMAGVLASSCASAPSCASVPNACSMAFCSCSDRMVEPLSAFTLRARSA